MGDTAGRLNSMLACPSLQPGSVLGAGMVVESSSRCPRRGGWQGCHLPEAVLQQDF